MKLSTITTAAAAIATIPFAFAVEPTPIKLNPEDDESIRKAASQIAFNMMRYYTGNNTGDTPGYLPAPHYWWEAGAMMGSLVDYWYYTGDDSYNDVVEQALVHQAGDDRDYMPTNASKSLGNDDQGFWGMSAMTAAETKFQDPPPDQPQWLALAQAVFAKQSARWDTTTCGGGLRWQIFTFNKGYDYKNSISNGAMFNLAARLARYTGNTTYADWAEKTWDWMDSIHLIGEQGTPDAGKVFDGSDDKKNCTELDHMQWSYNAGIMMHGAANMYNITEGADKARWLERATRVFTAASKDFFYKDTGIMWEQACEEANGPGVLGTCNQDQVTFKAYLSRWLAATSVLVPDLTAPIMKLLTSSAIAAAGQCMIGDKGAYCGTKWFQGSYDGNSGPGQQMTALEVVQSLLVDHTRPLVTNTTGGTSKGDENAGSGNKDGEIERAAIEVTPGGTAGAAILTALLCVGVVVSVWFMLGTDGWVG